MTGKDQATAQENLASGGLKFTVTNKSTDDKEQVGKVLEQEHPAGITVPRDTSVNLIVGVQRPSSASSPGHRLGHDRDRSSHATGHRRRRRRRR